MSRYTEDQQPSDDEIVRVTRVIEYIGPRGWVEMTLSKSIHGTYTVGGKDHRHFIREVSVTPVTPVESD